MEGFSFSSVQMILVSKTLKFFNREFDLGDFIQAGGEIFRTRSGEVTLKVS